MDFLFLLHTVVQKKKKQLNYILLFSKLCFLKQRISQSQLPLVSYSLRTSGIHQTNVTAFEILQGIFSWDGGQSVKWVLKHSSCCFHPQNFSCSSTTIWLLTSFSVAREADSRLVGWGHGWLPKQGPPA